MKKILPILLLVISSQLYGQRPAPDFLETDKRSIKFYAEKYQDFAIVYKMGGYIDKAGTGSSISELDSLFLQTDNNFKGKKFKIESIQNKLYISSLLKKKSKKHKLKKIENFELLIYNLNNAYYLDEYFAMTKRLNNNYVLNHHDFRIGFKNWKNLTNKKIAPNDFKIFVNKEIQKTEDSISNYQETLVKQTNFLINNIEKIDYPEFKNGLTKIPAEYPYKSSYYKHVVSRISRRKPEYVISLYKDFPENKSIIEFAVEKQNSLIQKLKAIQKNEVKLSRKK